MDKDEHLVTWRKWIKEVTNSWWTSKVVFVYPSSHFFLSRHDTDATGSAYRCVRCIYSALSRTESRHEIKQLAGDPGSVHAARGVPSKRWGSEPWHYHRTKQVMTDSDGEVKKSCFVCRSMSTNWGEWKGKRQGQRIDHQIHWCIGRCSIRIPVIRFIRPLYKNI